MCVFAHEHLSVLYFTGMCACTCLLSQGDGGWEGVGAGSERRVGRGDEEKAAHERGVTARARARERERERERSI